MPAPPSLRATAACAALAFAPVLAQRLPVPGDATRVVQVLALGPALDHLAQPHAEEQTHRELRRKAARGLGDALRACVEPPLTGRDGIEVLGDETLVVLGLPEQAAWVEQALRRAARTRLVQAAITCRALKVTGRAFAASLEPAGAAGGKTLSLTDAALATLEAAWRPDAGVATLGMTRLVLAPAEPGDFAALRQKTRYRKDVIPQQRPDGTLDLVTCWDLVEHGPQFAAAWLPERDGAVAVGATWEQLTLVQPMATFESTIGQQKVTIDLPSCTIVRLQVRGMLEKGHSLLAPQQQGEDWLVLLVTWSPE